MLPMVIETLFCAPRRWRLALQAELTPTAAIFGGALIGVRAGGALYFYDWETNKLARRIDVDAKLVFWSENGEFLAIATDDGCFVLKFDREVRWFRTHNDCSLVGMAQALQAAFESTEPIDDAGVEAAFDLQAELEESVRTATWVGGCFIFTNAGVNLNR